ncbi:MAG: hypothetical protein HOV92_18185 [Streptomyces sp.]|nr:hypothetical protein [Streptomyces sp.]
MAYQAAAATGDRSYHANVRSVALVGDYPVDITCVASTDNINADQVAEVFQAFVDMVANSSAFTIASAVRQQSWSENITA